MIKLAHGSGGEKTRELIEKLFLPAFKNPILEKLEDSGRLNGIAITIDGYTVKPIFFRGGDIGKLSITGTVNDLAVCGARPKAIAVSIIVEDGFPTEKLEKIVSSMAKISREVNAPIVTGDFKVVSKGEIDEIFIITSGIGEIFYPSLGADRVSAGDRIIVSGPIGDHSLAIMGERYEVELPQGFESDCAPILKLVEAITQVGGIKWMRDPTRGGLAAALNELAKAINKEILIYEDSVPFRKEVLNFCEIFGFDPYHLASEGRFIAVVDKEKSEKILSELTKFPEGKNAAIIGEVREKSKGRVIVKTKFGGLRLLDPPTGELLPRIC
ncbi:MAG: hydrogenase expression/formation protein HypE [Synergistetes bacterium]|nr:MAG: Hydrogenase expression/formation protein HypE [bacterium 42_11]MBC7332332.1 hydrogenase expression/formation protein HypE [Synergistota bacterium]MDK2871700.1 hydrogenase expression/formation protein HypE [bacterium]